MSTFEPLESVYNEFSHRIDAFHRSTAFELLDARDAADARLKAFILAYVFDSERANEDLSEEELQISDLLDDRVEDLAAESALREEVQQLADTFSEFSRSSAFDVREPLGAKVYELLQKLGMPNGTPSAWMRPDNIAHARELAAQIPEYIKPAEEAVLWPDGQSTVALYAKLSEAAPLEEPPLSMVEIVEEGSSLGDPPGLDGLALHAHRIVAQEGWNDAPSALDIVSECLAVASMLVQKNAQYGDSALNPVRIFSKASAEEQILVRLDDKLSRLARGNTSLETEDVVQDILGYMVLLRVARSRAAQAASEEQELKAAQAASEHPSPLDESPPYIPT